MSRFTVLSVLFLAALPASQLYADGLSLSAATQRVLASNPEMAINAARIDAATGRVIQAGALPNPELSYLLEDFAGDTRRSAGEASTTYSLSQRFSLPGKRSARQAFASEDGALTALEAQSARLRLIRVTRETYIDALAGAERQAAAAQNQQLAEQLRDAVAARVAAGKVSPIELSRANVALAGARRASQQSARLNELSRKQLAGLWGGSALTESLLDSLALPASLTSAALVADSSPLILQARKRIQREQAAVALAEAQRLPDFTVSGGMKREAMSREQSVLVGISVPIPLFDRNRGAVQSARAELRAAEASLTISQQLIQREQEQLLTQREGNYQDALQLRDEVLAIASEALEATREGYRAGKFSLIDLLDAQRSVVDAQTADLAARITFHKSDAALDELLGRETLFGITP